MIVETPPARRVKLNFSDFPSAFPSVVRFADITLVFRSRFCRYLENHNSIGSLSQTAERGGCWQRHVSSASPPNPRRSRLAERPPDQSPLERHRLMLPGNASQRPLTSGLLSDSTVLAGLANGRLGVDASGITARTHVHQSNLDPRAPAVLRLTADGRRFPASALWSNWKQTSAASRDGWTRVCVCVTCVCGLTGKALAESANNSQQQTHAFQNKAQRLKVPGCVCDFGVL